MAYEDVPQRMLDGEDVPRSEIIGYNAPMTMNQTDLILHRMEQFGLIEGTIVDEVRCFRITPFGHTIRQDFVQRIEGDCPECP